MKVNTLLSTIFQRLANCTLMLPHSVATYHLLPPISSYFDVSALGAALIQYHPTVQGGAGQPLYLNSLVIKNVPRVVLDLKLPEVVTLVNIEGGTKSMGYTR